MAGKARNTESAKTGKVLPSLANILLDALSGPDDELGKLLLGIFIQVQAQDLGIPTDQIPDDFGEKVVEHVKTQKAGSAREAALEKALHFAAEGDFKTSGRFLREHMVGGANSIAIADLARRYVPTGIRKLEQAREFGDRGGSINRREGLENRQAVLAVAGEIIRNRKNTRRPTVRQLAPDIARETKLSESTVRRHLTKAELNKLLD